MTELNQTPAAARPPDSPEGGQTEPPGDPPPDTPAGFRGHPIWRVFRRLGPAGPLAVVAASAPAIPGFALLGSMYWIAPWLREHPIQGLSVYILGYAVLGGLALMPTYAHSVLGGWAFGSTLGLPVALAAAMTAFGAAASLAYAIGRLASGDRVVQLLEEHAKTRAVYHALLQSGFWKSLMIVTLIRIPPNSPFAITNLALSAARVHPIAYLLGTLAGMTPRTGIAIFIGAGLSQLTFDNPHRISLYIGGLAATLIVLAILGYLGNRAIAQVTGSRAPDHQACR
jgi:uncharacterized membrane protein YdjX (TVP38/TMEM64 family)